MEQGRVSMSQKHHGAGRGDRAEEAPPTETGSLRRLRPHEAYLVTTVGVAWALYQLALPSVLIIDQTIERAIHLAFAMGMVFLVRPFSRLSRPPFRRLAIIDGIPIIDYLCAALGALTALYLALDYEGIAMRAGIPITRDIIIGTLLVLLLLEATRRMVGPALSVIAILFTVYAFLGPHLPGIFGYKGVSLTKYISNITMSTEGIYGIPIGVSSAIVYLFVLLGALLDRAGAGRFFTNLALSILGPYKGGAAKASVVASAATGLVSGSSIANIVTTGNFTIPLMKKIGYPPKKAAAIEVASSTDGQLMPPIMGAAAFIIAEYVNVPYVDVIKAAAIPAFASYFGLFCITHLEASKLGIKGLPREDVPSFFGTLKEGFHYVIPIGVLLFELMYLRHSPELAAFRAMLVLFIIVFYQEIRNAAKERRGVLWGIRSAFIIMREGMVRGSRNMMAVALACASAGIIVGIVNMGIGGMISSVVEYISGGNFFLLLLITAFASLMIGMGLPTTATYIVMASLTAPVIVNVAGLFDYLVPLMAAHLFCFYFGILADDTPPVGLAAYAASAIARSEPIPTGIQGFLYDVRTSFIAFMFMFNPELILHGVNSWPQAILIFSMALIGMSAFECFAQGWCITKNRWYDIPFFLATAYILLHPGGLASLLHVDQSKKYYLFFVGLLIYGMVMLIQRIRIKIGGTTSKS
jgi:TRAP transporter 4TM/12TM fusion protein